MHIPVLLHEVMEGLNPKRGETVLDATLGGGGHARALLRAISAKGTLIGLDEDEDAISRVKKKLIGISGKKILIRSNFRNLKSSLKKKKIFRIHKAIFDLGFSTFQLEDSKRGFSFSRDEPLQMTFGKNKKRYIFTAYEIVNEWEEKNLGDIIAYYGEEKFASRIARAIVTARLSGEIKTSIALAEIVKSAVPGWYRRGRIHSATKTFQAIRIAVNDELSALKIGLADAIEMLSREGRIAVISFHSLEDRIVKQFFKEWSRRGVLSILTKRPVTPGASEINKNPRARSAKLRIAQKI
ncbi:MAG: 16S rRNA (cytosine(1402)-N(4))-methyltransferase [Candidatus Lloydbacteria bacterium RIFCSPHIGHO2_01_FULL_41_20]|uniref:Ribosomal RNA small subunit methyltransferase H n=1 Tax=Candidatus Lloydbacteria bacterium RIFCSPHIGHO2_01_FULL_41_20 TaxID=1798657 RepID=A0A1G2CTI5_9BACT|nr:MAG: 16S rRNA (cytosine(1402)-N(4))-methyltransferase [Candidatus Lloydbacteria bacterium RIFCSPHIGHO2_01_FULL_41_20]